MSGYRPNRTIKFVFDTAEEFGYTDCWYDWSIGAWHMITQAPPGLGGQDRRHVEHRAHGRRRRHRRHQHLAGTRPVARLGVTIVPTIPALIPNGYQVETPQSTWQNGWSFHGQRESRASRSRPAVP